MTKRIIIKAKFILLILSFPYTLCFAQTENELQYKIDSLNIRIKIIYKTIDSLTSELYKINQLRNNIELFNLSQNTFLDIVCNNKIDVLSDLPDLDNKIITSINKNENIRLLDYDKFYFVVKHKDTLGYCSENSLLNAIAKSDIRKVKTFMSLQVAAHDKMAAAIGRKLTGSRKEFAKNQLTHQYPISAADRIIDGKIWIGMTVDMAIDIQYGLIKTTSFFLDNRKIELMTYSGYDGKHYLFFENGLLVSWLE